MKIKFITGFGGFGGSTIALIEHCKLLSDAGFDVEFYCDSSWAASFFSTKKTNELKTNEEDILIYHALEMKTRPVCKRCFLYVHEKSVFDLKQKSVSGYDGFIFVDEKQIKYHEKRGFVVPNPMNRMVDKSKHNPPNKNIAGVVGTIQSRKQQKISILKALENGASKVLLFGDKEDNYFEKEILPLLGEKVEYRGFYEPSKRMDMYNEFDVLYHFSSDESASLVFGECKILEKKIIKSKEVTNFEIVDDQEIIEKWKFIFAEKLACVVTHNRKNFIDKWLRAWNNADKYGIKIAVLHSCDEGVIKEDEKNNILQHNPDFYIPFKNNELRDLQALMNVVQGKYSLPDFDYLFWFTDDMIPMRRNFINPFLDKIQKPNVGLVTQCYEPKSPSGIEGHIRTVAYAITKDVAKNLEFPQVGPLCERGHYFEYGNEQVFKGHILKQVLDMGKKFELCHSEIGDNYQHWTSFLDWMWDCHLLGHWSEYEKIYESQFSNIQRLEDIKTKKELLITTEQCEDLTLIPQKICCIIPTSTAPIESFVWSIFSLLTRSSPDILEHFIVGINGPDKRTGDPSLQDTKQKFIEELRDLTWHSRSMPVTLVRTWSRIGHAQVIEQCIPWVHTEFYVSMHDDVIILDKNWCDQIYDFSNEKLICKTFGPPIHQKLNGSGDLLCMPHFNSIFTLCKKSRMKAINASWIGYHVPVEFYIDNFWPYEDFIEWHKKNDLLCEISPTNKSNKYKVLSMDIGCCLIPDIINNKYQMQQFQKNTIRHFSSLSWNEQRGKDIASSVHKEVLSLEKELIKNKDFWNLYNKYVTPNVEKKSF